MAKNKSNDVVLHQAQGEPAKVVIPDQPPVTDPTPPVEIPSTAPVIRTYGFIRVSDGQVGGFTTVITTIQGDKVLSTEILDKIYNKPSGEDLFRVYVAREVFHIAPDTVYQIVWKDGAYTWKL